MAGMVERPTRGTTCFRLSFRMIKRRNKEFVRRREYANRIITAPGLIESSTLIDNRSRWVDFCGIGHSTFGERNVCLLQIEKLAKKSKLSADETNPMANTEKCKGERRCGRKANIHEVISYNVSVHERD
ncbi:7740_t:CDS:2 [Acaulospora morrowiae]|uniref:7740_t:CDS:1 n=1 Tax=Acaulospora morrowiae TaxID=94023 RepID=A0A9N8Z6L7_9GLOM|nr:7740_t:CDS:2 [Acaulospora morrowiae]